MRMGTWGKPLQGQNGQIKPKSRLKELRKGRTRRVELEGLEARTLLSTLPAATTTAAPINLTGLGSVATQGNADSPTVVIDPADPTKMISTWVVNNPSIPPNGPYVNVNGAYSIDSGKDWLTFSAEVVLFDPATTNPTIPYADITNPTVSFDDVGNFYILRQRAQRRFHQRSDRPGEVLLHGGHTGPGHVHHTDRRRILRGPEQRQHPRPVAAVRRHRRLSDDERQQQPGDPVQGSGDRRHPVRPLLGERVRLLVRRGGAAGRQPAGPFFNPFATILIASSDGGNSFSARRP